MVFLKKNCNSKIKVLVNYTDVHTFIVAQDDITTIDDINAKILSYRYTDLFCHNSSHSVKNKIQDKVRRYILTFRKKILANEKLTTHFNDTLKYRRKGALQIPFLTSRHDCSKLNVSDNVRRQVSLLSELRAAQKCSLENHMDSSNNSAPEVGNVPAKIVLENVENHLEFSTNDLMHQECNLSLNIESDTVNSPLESISLECHVDSKSQTQVDNVTLASLCEESQTINLVKDQSAECTPLKKAPEREKEVRSQHSPSKIHHEYRSSTAKLPNNETVESINLGNNKQVHSKNCHGNVEWKDSCNETLYKLQPTNVTPTKANEPLGSPQKTPLKKLKDKLTKNFKEPPKCFELVIPYSEWNSFVDRSNPRQLKMKPYYGDMVYKYFSEHNPYCPLKFGNKYFKKSNSRKKVGNFFTAEAICKHGRKVEPEKTNPENDNQNESAENKSNTDNVLEKNQEAETCSLIDNCMKFNFVIKDAPHLNSHVRISVTSFGNYCHKEGVVHKRHIRKPDRLIIAESNTNKPPSKVAEILTAKCKYDVLNQGNATKAPTKEIIATIQKEYRAREDLHKDDYKDVRILHEELKKVEEFEGVHFNGFIRKISEVPFAVVFYSENQLHLVRKILEETGCLNLFVDASCNIARSPEGVKKKLYYYAIVAKVKGSDQCAIPIAECFTSDNTVCGIDYFLDIVTQDLKVVLGSSGKVATKVETDFSFAMMQSVSRAFNRSDLINYINEMYDVLTGTKEFSERSTVHHICNSHVTKFVHKKIDKLSQGNSVASEMAKIWFAQLQKCKTLPEAELLVSNFTKIVSSEFESTKVEDALNALSLPSTYEGSRDFSSSESLLNLEEIKEISRDVKEKKNQRERSHFTAHFRRIMEEARSQKCESISDTPNAFYIPNMMQYMEDNLFAYFPLWSGVCFAFLPDYKDLPDYRETTSSIESFIRKVKYNRQEGLRNVKIGRCIRNASLEIVDIISKKLFPYRKRKNNKKEKHGIDDKRRKIAMTPLSKENFRNVSTRKKRSGARRRHCSSESESSTSSVMPLETWRRTKKLKLIKKYHERPFPSHNKQSATVDEKSKKKLSLIPEDNNSIGDMEHEAAYKSCKKVSEKLSVRKQLFSLNAKQPYLGVEQDPQKDSSANITIRKRIVPNRFQDYEMYPDAKKPRNSIFSNNFPIASEIHSSAGKPSRILHEAVVDATTIKCLDPTQWLNDDIVHAFLSSITEELQEKGYDIGILHPEMQRRLRDGQHLHHSAYNIDAFKKDIILMPVAYASHWFLIVVELKKKYITTIHSLSKYLKTYKNKIKFIISILLKFLNAVHMNHYHENVDWSTWSIFCPSDNPNQSNSYDCGVHICIYAYLICRGPKIKTFNDRQVLNARRFIAHFLVNHVQKIDHTLPYMSAMQTFTSVEYRTQVLQAFAVAPTFNLICDSPIFQLPVSSTESDTENNVLKLNKAASSLTVKYLCNIVESLFLATEKICAYKERCLQVNENMIHCDSCRDFYHFSCIKRLSVDSNVENFICPSCSKE